MPKESNEGDVPSTGNGTAATRKFELSCACGSVHLVMKVPDSSFKYAMCIYCHCHDCVNFPNTVVAVAKKEIKDMDKNMEKAIDVVDHSIEGAEHLHFFKSDLESLGGEEFLGKCRLTPKSDVVRFYSKCCGTPLGFQSGSLPGFTLYRTLVKGDEVPAPWCSLNHASAPPDKKVPENIPVYDGVWLSKFMAKSLYRAVVGKLMGKGEGGLPVGNENEIGIGLESIALNK